MSMPLLNLTLFWSVYYSQRNPGLPDMKLIGTQTKRAAAMDSNKQTGLTDIVIDRFYPDLNICTLGVYIYVLWMNMTCIFL